MHARGRASAACDASTLLSRTRTGRRPRNYRRRTVALRTRSTLRQSGVLRRSVARPQLAQQRRPQALLDDERDRAGLLGERLHVLDVVAGDEDDHRVRPRRPSAGAPSRSRRAPASGRRAAPCRGRSRSTARDRLGARRRLAGEREPRRRRDQRARGLEEDRLVVDGEDLDGAHARQLSRRVATRTGASRVGRMAIRVAVAEDSLLVREGICELLAHEPDVEVVAAVGDLPSLERAIDDGRARRRAHRHPHAARRHRRGHPARRAAARHQPADRRRRAEPARRPGLRARAARARVRPAAPTCSRTGCPTAPSCSPRSAPSPPAGR